MADRLALIQELFADDAAIDRMATRLLAEVSLETGAIEAATPTAARTLIQNLLMAADDSQWTPTGLLGRLLRQQASDERENAQAEPPTS